MTNLPTIKRTLFVSSFFKLTGLYLIIGLVTRVILLINEQTQINFNILEYIRIFLIGAFNDICVVTIGYFFLWLSLIFMSKSKYRTPWGYIIFSLLGVALGYVVFFNTIFHEYGSVVPKIVIGLLGYKFISFGIRLFIPQVRDSWSRVCYYLVFFIYVTCILFIAIGEYFFWDEFGVRYNFIAVDYLVYTNEVIGNIIESYPIAPLFIALFVISGTVTYFLVRKDRKLFNNYPAFSQKILITIVYFVLLIGAYAILNFIDRQSYNNNVFANELQANGSFNFCKAFKNSELRYADFYVTLPEEEVLNLLNTQYNSKGLKNLQQIQDSLPEIHKNIVLITIESMSASFLKRYGNTDSITPYLDKLIDESLVFDNLYATGNRTVRGLEAVTLCLPPSPGESIIKRSNNSNLFSTGKVLKDKGYIVQFLYGGDSYFDNMGTFFGGNGYEIIDKNSFSKDEITFSNIWGVCDEDMYSKAISVFNKNSEKDKPFLGHIMTVSNHRPFTYPEDKIDISPNSKSRKGGIKYTDYAIGKFMEEARKQDWFDNTIFVIVADHCASSAGKTEIPLDKYHIPALVYAPGFIEPQQIDKLVSQIDIMPTVFGLLHFSYDSQFYGKDVFSEGYKPRALVATYQNLGYWEDDILTILSPVRRVEQHKTEWLDNYNVSQTFTNMIDSILVKQAIAHYQ